MMNKIVISLLIVGLAIALPAKKEADKNTRARRGFETFNDGGYSDGGGDIISEGFSHGGYSDGGGDTISGGFSDGGYSDGGFSNGGGDISYGFSSSGSSFGGFDTGFSSGHSSSGHSSSGHSSSGHSSSGGAGISFGDGCGGGQIRSADGSCITPQITRNLYLYNAPAQARQVSGTRIATNNNVHVNYVFLRNQNSVGGSNAVVIPPPKQKTLVYVLNRRPDALNQQVIEVPSAPVKPDVYFVSYDEGDDTQLPGGVSLQEALSQSVQQGARTIHGSGGASLGSIGGDSFIGGGSFIHGGDISGGSSGGYGF